MKQKEVDAIVLEILNICREKKLNFELRISKVTESIIIRDYDDDCEQIFKVESYINIDSGLFGYTYIGTKTHTIQEALEQVKQYKK